jgi:hypothetical protein
MDIVKKNIVSIICGVIALLAIVASYIPLGGWFESLGTEVRSRSSVYGSLNGLLTKQRSLPNVNLDQPTPPPLNQFPTDSIIRAADDVNQRSIADISELQKKAVALSQRPPIGNSLPRPTNAQLFSFRDEYEQLMDVRGRISDPSKRQTLLVVKELAPGISLRAGLPPSDAEIERIRASEHDRIVRAQLRRDDKGKPLNEAEVQEAVVKRMAEVPDELRKSVAASSAVYVNPDTLQVVDGIIGSRALPNLQTVWNANYGYWIQADILEQIARANQGARNVVEAPIKHIVSIRFSEEAQAKPATGGGDFGSFGGVEATAPTSVTKRSSNELYNVVPFELVLVVDATRIPEILLALSRNKYITVSEMNVNSIDAAQAMLNGFFYTGDRSLNPVVQLELKCEMLVMTEWLFPLMPEVVKSARQPAPAQ